MPDVKIKRVVFVGNSEMMSMATPVLVQFGDLN
jgi:hypothetical protein